MVYISKLIRDDLVLLDLEVSDKSDALHKITAWLCEHQCIPGDTQGEFCERLTHKEDITSTAVGNGLAIPHIYFEKIPEPIIMFVRFKNAIEFGAPDNKPVDKVFLLMGPKRDNTEYLQILARLSHLFKDAEFNKLISSGQSKEDILQAIRDVDSRH